MLGGFGTGWLSLGTKTSCPDFSLSARAGSLALEREKHPSSISCAGLDARAGVGPLERESVSVRLSGGLSARAGRLGIKSCFDVLKQFFSPFQFIKP